MRMDFEPRDGTREARRRAARVHIPCPHCHGPTRIGGSKTHDALYRQIYFSCLDFECNHRFSADLIITHTIAPSATPNPAVTLRIAPARTRSATSVPTPANDGGPEVPTMLASG